MPYDESFYDKYRRYLNEKTVREAHDWVFNIAKLTIPFGDVLDLGCGTSEFYYYGRPNRYLGIDENAPAKQLDQRSALNVLQADYRQHTHNPVPGYYDLFGKDRVSLVSLFSIENTDVVQNNYNYYTDLFLLYKPWGMLTSGFYYANQTHINPVVEAGGLLSYQTLEATEDFSSSVFEERRIVLPVPSQLFGDDVYEVWKLLLPVSSK